MEKTMGDMVKFLKQLIPVNIPETYTVKSMFKSISEEENIRKGVLAFRNFLYRTCDSLIADETLSKIAQKGKKKFADETTITVEYPFLSNIRSILFNVGILGSLSKEGDSLTVNDWESLSIRKSLSKYSKTKISVPQMIKTMKFLTECGIVFEGFDWKMKKADISKIEQIKIKYPDDPIMLTGWKALAIAQNEFSERNNDDILMRCDYRVIKNEKTEIDSILSDFVAPLPTNVRDFVLNLHQHCLGSGMTCNVELRMFNFHFVYSYKKKPLWRFSSSLNNGNRILIKTKNSEKYPDVIENFPDFLREKIAKGYGCDRKAGTGHGQCQKGCEGFRFTLNESTLAISQDIEIWLDSEIESMQKRKKS